MADCCVIHRLLAGLHAKTGEPVSLVETHISWVLLAGQDAYKLQKPVQLPLVDFRKLSSRLHFCQQEDRLNRHLASLR
jgi:aminoglycoside phosphotransferase family enzyme